jgi:hypothetical protein
MADEITAMQIRMARVALKMSLRQLASRAGIATSTLQMLESPGRGVIKGGVPYTLEHRKAARAESLDAVRNALVDAGATFLPDDGKTGPGVRVRASERRKR